MDRRRYLRGFLSKKKVRGRKFLFYMIVRNRSSEAKGSPHGHVYFYPVLYLLYFILN